MGKHKRPSVCKECGTVATRQNVISFRGLCARCTYSRVARNIASQRIKQGPEYELWRAGMARYIKELDDL